MAEEKNLDNEELDNEDVENQDDAGKSGSEDKSGSRSNKDDKGS